MTTTQQHVSLQTFVFSQEALDKRLANAEFNFLRSYGAVDRFSAPTSILMPQLETLFKEGRTLSEYHKPESTISLTVYLLKINIEELLEQVAEQTKALYLSELEEEKKRQQAILEQQLYQAQKDKEAKKEADKEAKLRAEAAAEAQRYFDNLSSAKEVQ
ncbi:hypothetical protein IFT47_03175 [Pseudomonas sp. CFBP 13711]|uniref:hypothetical protein n=1 Tax=unclassified Pseudomonas TaxID=196821 RepID=UPI001780096C|nr:MULTISPECIES: hypothetical protein [unclassified Pseudomonas]MBD8705632.1 hypothetical protein [Pseudomonas sp. CFBP 13711]MBD8710669.1 hypothetical protein [Pseudomonas sp. CFBP 13715]